MPKIQIDSRPTNGDVFDVRSKAATSSNSIVKENATEHKPPVQICTAPATATTPTATATNVGAATNSRDQHSYKADTNIKILSKPTTGGYVSDMPAKTQVEIISTNTSDNDTVTIRPEETSTSSVEMAITANTAAVTVSLTPSGATLTTAAKIISNKQNNTSSKYNYYLLL